MLRYEISPQEMKELFTPEMPPGCVLLDVREAWEHEEANIEGSLLMPMSEVPARAKQELKPESRILVFCHHGMRSMSVTLWLREHGFDQAQSLHGGIDAWSREIDASIPQY